MKVDPLQPVLTQLAKGASAISFAGGGDFASKLTLGQIIKGRVLRSYEGGRYLVDFAGQQKVVDSAVPLSSNEVIVGRVIGLGEQVELQRINANVAPPGPAVTAQAPSALPVSGKSAELIAGLFGRFQAELTALDSSALQRAIERAPQPETMALSGLVLSKLGIPLTPETLRAVFEALRSDGRSAMFALPEKAIHLGTQPAGTQAVAPAPVTQALSALLSEMLSDVPELQQPRDDQAPYGKSDTTRPPARDRRGPMRDSDQGGDTDVARLILNVQTGGAVAHRVGTLPIFVDGRLVELDVALFEQPSDSAGDRTGDGKPALQHRQVVFAVTTEMLGRVEVRATVAGTHMRVQVGTQAQESTQFMAHHAARLTADLEGLGWQIDELAYQTVVAAAPGVVARTVLEHLIAPGSVSALA